MIVPVVGPVTAMEREIVRLFYLEGRTYEEISAEVDVPVNSIGAVLSRARAKLRELSKSYTALPAVRPRVRKSRTKLKPVPPAVKPPANSKPKKPEAGQ